MALITKALSGKTSILLTLYDSPSSSTVKLPQGRRSNSGKVFSFSIINIGLKLLMFSLAEKANSANMTEVQRVQTLIIGRLLMIFLLLVSSWVWYTGRIQFSFDSIPRGPLLVFIVSIA